MNPAYIISTRAISQDFDLACKTIMNHGFGIEIDCVHLSDYTRSDIEPYAIHLPYEDIPLTSPDEDIRRQSVKRIVEELEKAHSKKVKLAVLHIERGYDISPKIPINEKANHFKMAAGSILEIAGNLGIKIALENNGFAKDSFSDPDEILMVIEDLATNYNNVGICFDTGHANIYASDSGKDLTAVFQKLKRHTIHVHLHENHGTIDEHLAPQGIFENGFYKKLMTLNNSSFTFETKGDSGINGILKGIGHMHLT
ncbi:sugar phosphate isomerase/epimerase [Thermodesulfovibrionales bacterium]|nr:sugar phosphate isomerase/epimerase [Thermodesulfovibrionales bacterium]MCL0034072.1 sugar phosphate isomerase/epimerase [Thermodesulfovibrionales bacterium]MCL0035559.1 sugar phosphate isomerase/epimerase [Thermodesulfovibrionales bacterium]MCL0051295.1 sugar phosphate isomerase/epimerase [Thermodesulfovibrionales bacterium]MCL0070990.1 sugar phosphate isomerase/epimerase [Thermodesulfovibrionales bacterium]